MIIYLDFQLIRFIHRLLSLIIVVGSYPTFSPLPLKAVIFCYTLCQKFISNTPACPLDSMMLYVARTFLRNLIPATDIFRSFFWFYSFFIILLFSVYYSLLFSLSYSLLFSYYLFLIRYFLFLFIQTILCLCGTFSLCLVKDYLSDS